MTVMMTMMILKTVPKHDDRDIFDDDNDVKIYIWFRYMMNKEIFK